MCRLWRALHKRHTHATLLLLEGINPKIVQERLGHSTVMITLDTYSHLLPDMQDTAVKALDGLFREKSAIYSVSKKSDSAQGKQGNVA